MTKETKTGPRRTSGADRSAADVKADDPKRSLDYLEALTRRVLKVRRQDIPGDHKKAKE